MTLGQYAELSAYWRRYPPPHLLLRAALGFCPPEPVADLSSLLDLAGPGGFLRPQDPRPQNPIL